MKTKTNYEIYWKNGESADKGYMKVGGLYRTMRGVLRTIRTNCNHSKGSDFKVYEITNGNKVVIDYLAHLK